LPFEAWIEAMSAQRVLVIDDEVPISLMMQGMLRELGYEVAGPRATRMKALALIESASTRFDAATVDIDLDGEPCAGVIAALNQRGIPFIVVTGFVDQDLPEYVRGRPVRGKPFTADDLRNALATLSLRACEAAPRQFAKSQPVLLFNIADRPFRRLGCAARRRQQGARAPHRAFSACGDSGHGRERRFCR
jgi:DNA-binding NtrC family response regulator